MDNIRISQSLIKDFNDFEDRNLCGKLFYEKWITRSVKIPSSEAMLMGQFFEYIATGSAPREMVEYFPDAPGHYFGMGGLETIGGFKAAAKKNVEPWNEILMDPFPDIWDESKTNDRLEDFSKHWKAKYVNLAHQALHLKQCFYVYGIEILETGVKVDFKVDNTLTRTMVWDVYAKITKMPDPNNRLKHLEPHDAIIDIKATGLINDGWKPYGWDESKLIFKDKLIIQPIDYMDQAREITDDYPVNKFYFFVHANTNDYERKIIQVNPSESVMDDHRKKVNEIRDVIELYGDKWEYFPSLDQCRECPLADKCAHKASHPFVKVVNIL